MMLFRFKFFFSALLLFTIIVSNFVHAVDFIDVGPPFVNINKIADENLANVSVILQDSDGFTWLVNDSGLLRYDGHKFKSFPGLEQFTFPNVGDIVEGQAGNLWIATVDNGLALFETNTEKLSFFALAETFDIATIVDSKPAQINVLTYQGGYLYLASNNEVLKVDEQNLSVVERYTFPLVKNDNIARLLVTSAGDIWCSGAQEAGVYRWSDKGVTHFEYQPNTGASISSAFVASIFEDSQKRIWFGGISGLDLFEPTSESFSHFIPFDLSLDENKNKDALANFVLTINEDNQGILWLGLLNRGVVKYQPEKKLFEHFPQVKGISSTIISDAMFAGGTFDRQQSLWVSTTKGVSKLSENNRKISQFANVDKDSCKGIAMHESEQGVLFGCNKSLYRLYQKQVTLVDNFNEKIVSIYQEAEGVIWLGTIGGGVYRYDLQERTTEHYGFTSDVNDNLGINIIYQLRADLNNDLYGIAGKHPIEKGSGLIQYQPKLDKFSNFPTEFELGNWVDIDQQRMVLVASFSNESERLYWFNKTKKAIKKLPIKTGNVLAIIKWRKQLWVSSQNLGLITIDLNTGKWQQLNNHFNDANNIITGFYLGPLAVKLYFTLDNQLYKFNSIIDSKIDSDCLTCSLEIDSLNINDPQTGQLFKGNGLLTNNKEFLISNINKFLSVPIGELAIAKYKSQLQLTNYQVMGKSVQPSENDDAALLTQSINKTKRLVIPPDTTFFSFDFAKVGSAQPQNVKYAYKLEGLNKDWLYTDAKHTQAMYTLLSPGNYTFNVKASDDNGQWQGDEKEVSLEIHVQPPWWQTWWAYSFYLVAIFSLFSLVFWVFYRKRLAEHERQTAVELANAKEQLLANVSHEFRTPLTLIMGPANTIKTTSQDRDIRDSASLIERNAQRLLIMVEQLLTFAKIKEPQEDDAAAQQVAQICQFVLASFAAIAQEKQINLKLNNVIDDSWWVSEEQNTLETILFNLLSNAIKFSSAEGEVRLSVTEQGQWLEFEVKDNGCGIAEHEQNKIFERFTRLKSTEEDIPGTGIGLALVKELVTHKGGNVSVNSRLGEGSCFTFTLPKLSKNPVIHQEFVNNKMKSNEESALNGDVKHTDNEQFTSDNIINLSPEMTASAERPSALIVEDNQELRHFIKQILKDNYQVLAAEHGKQGLELAREHSPDIIISDVMMPGMDGFELLSAVRNDMAICHIPLILLTAKGDNKSILKGLSDLADDYITKPFNNHDLLMRMQRLLGIRSILQKQFDCSALSNVVMASAEKNRLEQEVADDLPTIDDKFLQSFREILAINHNNSELSLPMVSSQLAMSDRQLQRKLRAISGNSFTEMLREYRLAQALQRLNSGEQIAVIADKIGFGSSSYFVRCFKAKYGKTPNEYRKAS